MRCPPRFLAGTALLLSLVVPSDLFAQHDPERDAMRLIAQGKYKQAAERLQKGETSEAERLFILAIIAQQQDRREESIKHLEAALQEGLPFSRLVAGPRDLLQPVYQTSQYKAWAKKYGVPALVHGPMLGSVTDSTAQFWVRTSTLAEVQVKVHHPDLVEPVSSQKLRTKNETDFTTVVKVAGLQASTEYTYEVFVDGKPQPTKHTHFRTSPTPNTPGQFRIAFGGGAGYVPKWEHMWETIRSKNPDAMLMLGDNVYIDAPNDAFSKFTPRYCYYRRQSRPEWRNLTACTAMYSIYDDHDFGTNDCVPGPEIEKPPWKREVWRYFKANWCNPAYGGGTRQPGCWYDFHIGDVQFFMLDGRYYRTRGKNPTMLGPAQKEWLLRRLKLSQATFKVIVSPVPFTENIKPGSKDPWDGFPEEREEIFSHLEKEKINGVFLMAADRHRSDLRITKRENGYDLYEFESSRLTNRHTHGVVKTPGLVWGYNKTCSFGVVDFDTKTEDPQAIFRVFDIDGKQIHEHTLKLSQLKHPVSE